MKNIALRSHDGSGWVSSLIAQGTYGEVNHSSIEFVEDGIVIEAHAKNGVVERSVAGHGKGDVVHRFVFPVSDEEYASALTFAREQVGKKYDNRAIIRFVPFLRNAVPADREEYGRWICSELAEVIMRKANIPTQRRDYRADKVSPQDQFKSIRCELGSWFGPFCYERLVRGVLDETATTSI